MAAGLTEVMPVTAMESTQLRMSKPSTSATSGRLFGPLHQSDATTKSEAAAFSSSRSRVDPQRGLQPARKKLTTLEAQRVMAVLTTAIRRVELASVLPQLVAKRRTDLDIGFGAELTSRLEEHGVLLGSLDELKEVAVKQQRRTSSAGSVASNRRGDSALSQHSTPDKHDATSVANRPDDQLMSPISTRSSIIFVLFMNVPKLEAVSYTHLTLPTIYSV